MEGKKSEKSPLKCVEISNTGVSKKSAVYSLYFIFVIKSIQHTTVYLSSFYLLKMPSLTHNTDIISNITLQTTGRWSFSKPEHVKHVCHFCKIIREQELSRKRAQKWLGAADVFGSLCFCLISSQELYSSWHKQWSDPESHSETTPQ